ncbi:MAG TPA: transketolase [Chthoniobacterales bacterium]|jgi:transketolase|nr:transketolase [Chthoniobacterales bacterium]
MTESADFSELASLARQGRWHVIQTVSASGAGHVGGPMSAMDLLIALYFRVMAVRPNEPQWPERDRFILSKGHSAIGLYTVMALRGYLPVEELKTFDKGNSRLQGHPDMTKLPGLETSTGSLGMGLSVGLGFAIGAQRKGLGFQTFVMIGDGELQEGMIWEALHVAPRYQVANLTAILDSNGLQQFGWLHEAGETGRGDRRDPWFRVDLPAVLRGLGWNVIEINGHDFGEIIPALQASKSRGRVGKPTMILAHTIKGKGVSFTEGKFEWHSKVAATGELEVARRELQIEEVTK